MTALASFLALIFTALALIPGGAHLFELPNKLRLEQGDYFITQSIYRGWQLVGILVTAALAFNLWSGALHDGAAAWLFYIAGALIAATLVVFFRWTFPVNKATHMWTQQPEDWRRLRTRWEYSHAASAIITFLALICASAAVVTTPADVQRQEIVAASR